MENKISLPGQMIPEDWKKWAKNLLQFSLPLFLITFITLIFQGVGYKQALVGAASTLITALIDLAKKTYGVNQYS